MREIGPTATRVSAMTLCPSWASMPNFAVLALGQYHFEDRGVASFTRGSNSPSPDFALGQPHPLGHLFENLGSWASGDDDSVDLFHPKFRMGQPVGELAVVGQEHQADTVLVEPADCVNPFGNLGQQIDDPGSARRVVVRRNVPPGLVNGIVDVALALDLLSIDRDDGGVGIDFRSQFANDLAVDRNSALKDQILARPARADACVCENLLEPLIVRIACSSVRRVLSVDSGLGFEPASGLASGPDRASMRSYRLARASSPSSRVLPA